MILHNCAFLLDLFQYNVETDAANRILRLQNTSGVVIGGACIGFEVTALFTALIISFKGPLSKKIWFIPLGVFIIYLLNLIRISALALLVTINPEIWELNHKFIFTIIVYSFIFMMWRYWLQLNSNLRNTSDKRITFS
jgi:exosortase/archaeosortase family protein